MAIFNFFKTPQVRQYHHEYIYYDPAKEERAEREKRVKEQIEREKAAKDTGSVQPMIRKGVFQEQRKTNSAAERTKKYRLMLMIGIIAFLIWFIR